MKSGRLRLAGHVVIMEKGRRDFKISTGTPTGNRHLGWPMRRWEGNSRIDFKEIGMNTMNWVDSAQDKDYCGFHKPWS